MDTESSSNVDSVALLDGERSESDSFRLPGSAVAGLRRLSGDFQSVSVSDLKTSHVCSTCGKGFFTKSNLTRHAKIHSSNVKPFNCEECGASFLRKDLLNRHLKTHNPITIECLQCKMQFTRNDNLKAHIRAIHGKPQLKCTHCEQLFHRKSHLIQHVRTSHAQLKHKCEHCEQTFDKKLKLTHHIRVTHIKSEHKCEQCEEMFSRKSGLIHHIRLKHGAPMKKKVIEQGSFVPRTERPNRKSALGVFASEIITPTEENAADVKMTFEELKPLIHQILREEIYEKRAIKWRIIMRALLTRMTADGEEERTTPYFGCENIIELTEDRLLTHIDEAIRCVENKLEAFVQLGSAWLFERVVNIEISTAKYAPLAGV